MQGIRTYDPAGMDGGTYSRRLADAVILTNDRKILLQQRTPDWSGAGRLVAFGGHVEAGESVLQALVRELHEELGAVVDPDDVVALGALTEVETGHTDLVHVHFWHDRNGTITGCHECEAVYYDRIAGALAHPMIMDYLRWALEECRRRGLLI